VSHTFTVAGDWNITLTSVHVCLGAEQVTIPVRTLGYTASIRPVSCAGGSDGSILLSPLPAGIASLSVSWSDNTLSGPSPGSLPEGDYIFSLDAADACPLTDTLTVSVDSLAFFRPDLGADRFFCPDDPVPLRTIGSYSGFLWQDGSTSDTLVPSGEGWYWVRVVSMSGCPGTDSVYLELNCMDIPFFPSAFTPNGDLVNDVFTVTYGSAEVLQWQVFDRWGKSVFRAMDTFAYWDGAGFPQGVYTCMVDYLDRDGLQRSRTGRVTLIR
jgi:gliding motility-associated-like protein